MDRGSRKATDMPDMPDMNATITAICIGKSVPFRGGEHSAIVKRPVDGPVAISRFGLAGDEQADRVNHGGPEMAVHVYPQGHHAFWRRELGDHALLDEPGAFGSNLAVAGLLEDDVYIGDRFRLGTALLEVSQPRKPCWKIEHRFGRKRMVATILKTGRCGWYFRVIEDGIAQTGDTLIREGNAGSQLSIAQVFALLWGNPKGAGQADLQALTALQPLAPKLRAQAEVRLGDTNSLS